MEEFPDHRDLIGPGHGTADHIRRPDDDVVRRPRLGYQLGPFPLSLRAQRCLDLPRLGNKPREFTLIVTKLLFGLPFLLICPLDRA